MAHERQRMVAVSSIRPCLMKLPTVLTIASLTVIMTTAVLPTLSSAQSLVDVNPEAPIPNDAFQEATANPRITCAPSTDPNGRADAVGEAPAWVAVDADPTVNQECLLKATCPASRPYARVLVGRLLFGLSAVAIADSASVAFDDATQLSPSTDMFGRQPLSTVMMKALTNISLARALVLCYISPCQWNRTNPAPPPPKVGDRTKQPEQFYLEENTVLLRGEYCLIESTTCPATPWSPLSTVRLISENLVRSSGFSTRMVQGPFNGGLPFTVHDADMQPLWPPDGDIAVGNSHATNWKNIQAFETRPHRKLFVSLQGPRNSRSATSPADGATAASISFQCFAFPCPTNGSFEVGERMTLSYPGNELINADCPVPVACRTQYRQLRMQNLSPCREVTSDCNEVFDISTNPEDLYGLRESVCSSANARFALASPLPTGADYRCPLSVFAACEPLCQSPNRTQAPDYDFFLTADVNDTDGTPTSARVVTDEDGQLTDFIPQWDAQCQWQARCKNPAEIVLFSVQGRLRKQDTIEVILGSRSGGGEYIARVRNDQYMPDLKIPTIGFGSGQIIYTQRGFTPDKKPEGTPGTGLDIRMQCITTTSFTCDVEPLLVWPGQPLYRNFSGLIPYIDTCKWTFQCPAHMFAGIEVDFSGGYFQEDYGPTESVGGLDDFDSTILQVQSATGELHGRIRAGRGLIFSSSNFAEVLWNSTGIWEDPFGSYTITFDCFVSRCPFNSTTPKVEASGARTLRYRNGDWYQDNEVTAARPEWSDRPVVLPRNIVNVDCYMRLECPAGTQAYFNYSGQNARGFAIESRGIGGDPALQYTHTTAWQEAELNYGVFLRAPTAEVVWSGPTDTKRLAEFDIVLGCSVHQCSFDDFDDDMRRVRTTSSGPRREPGSTYEVNSGPMEHIFGTFLYYINEVCELNFAMEEWPLVKRAMATIRARVLREDIFRFFDPDDPSRSMVIPDARYMAKEIPDSRHSILMSGRFVRVQIETHDIGRNKNRDAGGGQLAPGRFYQVFVHGLAGSCPTNASSQPLEVTVLPTATGSVQVHDLLVNGKPFNQGWQPYGAECEWLFRCASSSQRLLLRYAARLAGNYSFTAGQYSYGDSTRSAGGGVSGMLVVTPGETVAVRYATPLASYANPKQLFNAYVRGGGVLLDAKCIERECTAEIDNTVPIGGAESSRIAIDPPATESPDGLVTPLRYFPYLPPAPPMWLHDTRHPDPYRGVFGDKTNSPFIRAQAAGENCTFEFSCPNKNDTINVFFVGNRSTLTDEEFAVKLRPFDAITGLPNATFDKPFISVSELFDPSFVADGAARRSSRFGKPKHQLVIEMRPRSATTVVFQMELRCFVDVCCNNQTQPVLLSPATPDEHRRPVYDRAEYVCDADTEGQTCLWRTPTCENVQLALVVHPDSNRHRIVYPLPRAVRGRSSIHAVAVGYIELAYEYNTSFATFPPDGLVRGSCFACNVSRITQPTTILLGGAGVALPFSFICDYEFECDFEERPRVTISGMSDVDSALLRNLMASGASATPVDFTHGVVAGARGNLPASHPLADADIVDSFSFPLPLAASFTRGLYGIDRVLRLRLQSHLLSTPGQHAILLDVAFACDRRPCVMQSPNPPANYGDAVGPPPQPEDFLGGYKAPPKFPRQGAFATNQMLAYGRQRCEFIVPSQCSAGCLLLTEFRLQSPTRLWLPLNQAEQNSWNVASEAVFNHDFRYVADFVDSSSGADYMRLFFSQTTDESPEAVADALRPRRALTQYEREFPGNRQIRLRLDTTPSAVLTTPEFPGMEWHAKSASFTLTRPITRTRAVTPSDVTLSPSTSGVDTVSVEASESAEVSPSKSVVESPSETLVASDTQSHSVTPTVHTNEPVAFELMPAVVYVDSVNGGLRKVPGPFADRAFVIRANKTFFAVSNDVNELTADESALFEHRLEEVFSHPNRSASGEELRVLLAEMGAALQGFADDADGNSTVVAEENDSSPTAQRRRRREVEQRRVAANLGVDSVVDPRVSSEGLAVMFQARQGELLRPPAVVYARGPWMVMALQPDLQYFTRLGETVRFSPQRDILSRENVNNATCSVRLVYRRQQLMSGTAKTVVLAIGAASAVASMSPTSAMNFGRNAFLLDLAPCDFDPTEDQEFLDHPIGVGITDHPLQYQIGTAILNPALVLGVLLVYANVVNVYRDVTRQSFAAGAAKFKFPSTMLLPTLVLLEATLSAGILVAKMDTTPPTAPELGIDSTWRYAGFACIAFVVIAVGTVTVVMWRGFSAEISDVDTKNSAFVRFCHGRRIWLDKVMRPHASTTGSSSSSSGSSAADDRGVLAGPLLTLPQSSSSTGGRHGSKRLTMDQKRALMFTDPACEGYVARWGLIFDAFVPGRQWFLLAEIVHIAAISAMTAYAPLDGDCRTLTAVATGVFGLMWLAALGLRPYLTGADAVFQTVAFTVQFAVCVLTVLGQIVSPRLQYVYVPLTQVLVSTVSTAELLKLVADVYLHLVPVIHDPSPTVLSESDEKALQRHVQLRRAEVAALSRSLTNDTPSMASAGASAHTGGPPSTAQALAHEGGTPAEQQAHALFEAHFEEILHPPQPLVAPSSSLAAAGAAAGAARSQMGGRQHPPERGGQQPVPLPHRPRAAGPPSVAASDRGLPSASSSSSPSRFSRGSAPVEIDERDVASHAPQSRSSARPPQGDHHQPVAPREVTDPRRAALAAGLGQLPPPRRQFVDISSEDDAAAANRLAERIAAAKAAKSRGKARAQRRQQRSAAPSSGGSSRGVGGLREHDPPRGDDGGTHTPEMMSMEEARKLL